MADIERIRRAFGQLEYYRQHPQEIDRGIDDGVEIVTGAWKQGYHVVVVDQNTVRQFEAGQSVDVEGIVANEFHSNTRPEGISESQWRDVALQFLEMEAEKIATLGDLLLIKVNEATGIIEEAIFASSLSEEE